MDHQVYVQMGYALGVGLLVGLERSMGAAIARRDGAPAAPDSEASPPNGDIDGAGEFLGLRTFAGLSLTGFAAAMAGEHLPAAGAVVLAVVGILIVAMYVRVTEMGTGITTEVAAVCTCALGMLCRYEPHAAGVVALLLTVILASKRFTHATVGKMRRVELTDTLKFLVVILIVLPLLPNRALDPYGAFNPHKVGLLVVLISGISFVGYFLTRILGARRGLGLTGVVGGLTSSTAVTAAMAAEARRSPSLGSVCAFSTLAANATMFVRVLVVVALLDLAMLRHLAWSVGGMAVVALAAAVLLWIRASRAGAAGDGAEPELSLENPFSVTPALKFAAFFVGILFVVKLAQHYLGDNGLFAAAALSGLADVDAITLSVAEQTQAELLLRETGAAAVTIAVVANSVVKTGIAIYSGGWRFGRLVAAGLGAATAVGLVIVLAM